MRKTTLSRSLTLTAILCIIVPTLLGCAPQVTLTPETITTIASPTATQEFTPIVTGDNARDMIILSYEEDGFAHLFAYLPNQMPLTRLTSGDWDDIAPSPEPGGNKIAFASNRSGFWDLYLLDLSTGEVTQLTNTPEYESAPTWSPDGSFLAFETYTDDNLEIAVGPAKDPLNNAIRLTNSAAADYSPAWAPDGRHIAFVSDGEIILADLDKTDDSRFTKPEQHGLCGRVTSGLVTRWQKTCLGFFGDHAWAQWHLCLGRDQKRAGDLGGRWRLSRLEPRGRSDHDHPACTQ